MWSSDLTPDLDVFIDESVADEKRLERPSQSRPASNMAVIVCASQKGGSGKTTLASHIAVEADRNGAGPVALIDTDPQGSLADWWNARESETPLFVKTEISRLGQDLADLCAQGVSLVVIDTPPTVTNMIRGIIRFADLVVIPTRPSPLDLRAVGPTVDMVEQAEKPLVFVVNAATPRARITTDAAVALSQHGAVAPQVIHHRNDFVQSMIDGRTVMELRENSKSAGELSNLWAYLDDRLEQTVRQPQQEAETMNKQSEAADLLSTNAYLLSGRTERRAPRSGNIPNRWFGRRQTG